MRAPFPSLRRRVPALMGFALGCVLGCSECEKDFDCPGTKVCNVSEGTCEAFACKSDRDCPPTRTCKANHCKANRPPSADDDADAIYLSPPGLPVVPGTSPTDAGLVTPPG